MARPTLTTADGLELAVQRRLTDDPPRAAIVVVHGFSASAACPNVEGVAAALHADGYDVITYDARGHGESPGESTLGDHEQHDVAAAVELARRRTADVVLVGASMGAIATLRYAVTDPGLAGVVSVSCPAHWRLPRNIRGVLAAAMTRTPAGRRLTSRLSGVRVAARWTAPTPPVELVPRLHAPVVFVHGTLDRFIALRDAAELFERAPEPRRLRVVRGMGHAFEPVAVEPIRDAVAWALDQYVTVPPSFTATR
jgi:alpha-beta hydrolase superfamily lysophospholipase